MRIGRLAGRLTGRPARRAIGRAAAAGVGVSLVISLVVVPADARQGQVQRLLYLHVPTAWVAFGAFAVVFAGSVGYLRTGRTYWDRWAEAAGEAGIVFTGLTIALGMLWGRAVWGVWWTWDPRLTTTAILLLIYVGYGAVRRIPAGPSRSHRWAAVVGVVGFADVPIVHLSVVWWRSAHQPASVLRPGSPAMSGVMVITLGVAVVAASLLCLWLMLTRLAVRRLEDRLVAAALDRPVAVEA
jgi:heme exporter protein C